MATKTAFIIIATGQAYVEYAKNLITSMNNYLFFEFDVFAFSDNPWAMEADDMCFKIDHLGYPRQTLMRYHTILTQKELLSGYDQMFYVDADMEFVSPVKLEDIASKRLTATSHPGFFVQNIRGTTETRVESSAYCPHNTRYYCGGFQGGNAQTYLWAAQDMKQRIDQDEQKGIVAKWHDESHWNCLLADYPPMKVLTPSFCFPEDYTGDYGWSPEQYPAVLVALDKRKRGNHPRMK